VIELPVIVNVPTIVTTFTPAIWKVSVATAVPVRVTFWKVPPDERLARPLPDKTTVNPFQFTGVAPLWNVAAAPVSVTVAVFAETVKFVLGFAFQAAAVPVIVIAELPIVSVRATVYPVWNVPHVHACPFVFSTPAVKKQFDVTTIASASVTPPAPEPPQLTFGSVRPALVRVSVPPTGNSPSVDGPATVIPLLSLQMPPAPGGCTKSGAVRVNVLVKPVQSRFWQYELTSTVALPGELASRNASSVAVGTVAPDAPPVDALQLAVLDQFVPFPTQYLAAIATSPDPHCAAHADDRTLAGLKLDGDTSLREPALAERLPVVLMSLLARSGHPSTP
jgi:hypothetical protein